MPLNLPILLTWLRVALIPVFVGIFFLPANVISPHQANLLGAALFAIAGATDWLDGYLARRWAQTSAFGAFLDPVADKLIVAIALILLVYLGRTHVILAMIIIGREITISALREWMAEIGQRKSIAVAWIGKFKTCAQMLAILLLLWNVSIFPRINTSLLGNIFMIIAAFLTLWSMAYYLKMASIEFKKIDNNKRQG